MDKPIEYCVISKKRAPNGRTFKEAQAEIEQSITLLSQDVIDTMPGEWLKIAIFEHDRPDTLRDLTRQDFHFGEVAFVEKAISLPLYEFKKVDVKVDDE